MADAIIFLRKSIVVVSILTNFNPMPFGVFGNSYQLFSKWLWREMLHN